MGGTLHIRHLRCTPCDLTIRIRVPTETLGRTVLVTCPRCQAKYRTEVPKPPPEPECSRQRDQNLDLSALFEELLRGMKKSS